MARTKKTKKANNKGLKDVDVSPVLVCVCCGVNIEEVRKKWKKKLEDLQGKLLIERGVLERTYFGESRVEHVQSMVNRHMFYRADYPCVTGGRICGNCERKFERDYSTPEVREHTEWKQWLSKNVHPFTRFEIVDPFHPLVLKRFPFKVEKLQLPAEREFVSWGKVINRLPADWEHPGWKRYFQTGKRSTKSGTKRSVAKEVRDTKTVQVNAEK